MKVAASYSDLPARRALVTGASSGIGHGIAEAFLEQGMSVALQYRTNRAAAEVLAARFPGRAFAVEAELGTEAGCSRCVSDAAGALGGLDQIVHSAAIWNEGPIASIRAEQLEEIFRVNVFSAFYLVREALPHLGRRGRGNVVFIGSTGGSVARHGTATMPRPRERSSPSR